MLRTQSRVAALVGSMLIGGGALAAEPTASVEMKVTGFEKDEGKALCALFDEAGWLKDDKRLKGQAFEIKDKGITCRFEGLAPGRYGIVVFHDKNGNQRLDRNFLGIPSEPYCFSKDAKGGMGPPSFADAAIAVGDGPTRTACKL